MPQTGLFSAIVPGRARHSVRAVPHPQNLHFNQWMQPFPDSPLRVPHPAPAFRCRWSALQKYAFERKFLFFSIGARRLRRFNVPCFSGIGTCLHVAPATPTTSARVAPTNGARFCKPLSVAARRQTAANFSALFQMARLFRGSPASPHPAGFWTKPLKYPPGLGVRKSSTAFPHRMNTRDCIYPKTMRQTKNAQQRSPSPRGPRCAERIALVGQLSCGGLGKPLGRGEGEHSFHLTSPACKRIESSGCTSDDDDTQMDSATAGHGKLDQCVQPARRKAGKKAMAKPTKCQK